MTSQIYELRSGNKAIMVTGSYDVAKNAADHLNKTKQYNDEVYIFEYDFDNELWLENNPEEFMFV